MIEGQVAGRPGQAAGRPGRLQAAAARSWVQEMAVLAGFLAAGVAATWPLASYLGGELPASRDVAIYVWDLWWVAHQIIGLHDPWSTTHLAAPAGLQLGYHTLVPLLGALMIPVTLAFGPSAAYTLLTIAVPGLACYATYRAARLWLPTRVGAIAAGAFFGLSSCGLATTTAVNPAAARTRSRVRNVARACEPASQGTRQSAARITAITADS